MYRQLPKLEFSYRIAKTLSEDIENVYLPLGMNLPDSTLYIHNGGVAMRPGVDQLPGSKMVCCTRGERRGYWSTRSIRR